MYKHVSPALHLLILVLFVVLSGTCASSVYFIADEPVANNEIRLDNNLNAESNLIANIEPSLMPVPTLTPMPVPSPIPTFIPEPETGWALLQPGLERRVIPVYNDQNQQVESLHVWRLDQKYFRLDVAFEGTPKSLEAWQVDTGAAMVVNGGYYSINNEIYSADGLTVIHGQASGRSFNGYGGMLAVTPSRAELRWLVKQPYDPGERLQAALQAFPILVEPGGGLGFGPERENNVSARRTVIGQDRNGRILFIVAPTGYFTLHQLSAYLTESGLDLDMAINLDGGGSTGILVADPLEIIPPSRPLPFVILVYGR